MDLWQMFDMTDPRSLTIECLYFGAARLREKGASSICSPPHGKSRKPGFYESKCLCPRHEMPIVSSIIPHAPRVDRRTSRLSTPRGMCRNAEELRCASDTLD